MSITQREEDINSETNKGSSQRDEANREGGGRKKYTETSVKNKKKRERLTYDFNQFKKLNNVTTVPWLKKIDFFWGGGIGGSFNC